MISHPTDRGATGSRLFTALLAGACVLCASFSCPVRAATAADVEKMIALGKSYLYAKQSRDGTWETAGAPDAKAERGNDTEGSQWGGRTALCVYALLAAGERAQEPELARAIDFLKRAKLVGTYALGVRCQAMLLLPQTADVKAVLKQDAAALMGLMKTRDPATGFYDYDAAGGPTNYSLSRAQYAVLGCWAAAQSGVEIPTKYWETVERAWLRAQEADGGWAYQKERYPVTPGISAVGVATLYITQEYLAGANVGKCAGNAESGAIDRGLAYLSRNFDKVAADRAYERDFPFATLYAVERIGVASGRKYFGPAAADDWFAKGADWLLARQGRDGGWARPGGFPGSLANTCFAMLFLGRGRAPLMMNKLEYAVAGAKVPDWNQRPRDVANLSRWVGRVLERDVNWQVVNLRAPVADLFDAPILYVAGSEALKFTDAEAEKLRLFAEGGGIILGHADCGKASFAASFRALGAKLFPSYPFRELPDAHPLFNAGFARAKWKQKLSVLGVSNGVRELMLLIPQADAGKAWQASADRTREELFQLGADVFLYAVDRRNLRYRGDGHFVTPDPKVTPAATLAVARLRYDGNWDPEPGGWRRLAAVLHNERRTTLTVAPVDPAAVAERVAAPVAHLTGTGTFRLSEPARAAVGAYVAGGGTLVVDAAGGSAAFADAAAAEIAAMFPGQQLEVLPPDHPVYAAAGQLKIESFGYRRLAREKVVGKTTTPRVQGITIDGRVRVFFSREDLSAGLVGNPVDGVFGYEPRTAVDVMRNILFYAARLQPPPVAASAETEPGTRPAPRPRGDRERPRP